MNQTERELMIKIKQGNTEAFTMLFNIEYPEIYRFVYRLSGKNHSLTEDIVQNVFVKFWINRQKYDQNTPVKWLFMTIARGLWIDNLRLTKAMIHSTDKLQNKSSGLDLKSPLTNLEYNELKIKLEESITGLETPLREVLILSRFHNLRYKEIADILGISVKTVEARMSNALSIIDDKLKPLMEI